MCQRCRRVRCAPDRERLPLLLLLKVVKVVLSGGVEEGELKAGRG